MREQGQVICSHHKVGEDEGVRMMGVRMHPPRCHIVAIIASLCPCCNVGEEVCHCCCPLCKVGEDEQGGFGVVM